MRDSQVRAVGAAGLIALLVSRLLALVEVERAPDPGRARRRARRLALLRHRRLRQARLRARRRQGQAVQPSAACATTSSRSPRCRRSCRCFSCRSGRSFSRSSSPAARPGGWRACRKRIGGYTGDCLGATRQVRRTRLLRRPALPILLTASDQIETKGQTDDLAELPATNTPASSRSPVPTAAAAPASRPT